MYPPAEEIPLAANPEPPVGVQEVAVQTSADFKVWLDIDNKTCDATFAAWNSSACRVPEARAREMRRAYYACTTYVDKSIGMVLDALEANGFADDTVITVVGDHGWHLGELNEWAKYTNYEQGVRIPFFLHLAGQTTGTRTAALAEGEDIYPTVAEAAGLAPPPICADLTDQTPICVHGVSAVPLAADPDQTWKGAAFQQYPQAPWTFGSYTCCVKAPNPYVTRRRLYGRYPRPDRGFDTIDGFPEFNLTHSKTEDAMGYSVRTDTWRYTEWVAFDNANAVADWDVLYGRELYSHEDAPVPDASFDYNNHNLAFEESYQELVANLSAVLRAGWREQLPPSVR